MNAHPTLHPTDQTLSSYGLGKLDDITAEAVNEHLERCPYCRKRVAEMSADSFLGRIRDAQKPASHPMFGQAQSGGMGVVSSSVLARIAATVGHVPHVLLRDSELENGPGPIVKLSSTEIPELSERPDRYQLFGEIARGGMGAVLKGRDNDLGRDLAVKVLLESHRDKPELIRRFVEEAQIGGQLQHPGIVPIYELGTFADRRPFFAMKLVKGRTLSSLLDERGDPARELPRFLSIFASVCQTMAYTHARGVIHRDLKPSNIMVGSFGEVQVMDWGLAKVLPQGGAVDDAAAGKTRTGDTVIATARSAGDEDSDLSRAGSVMGTPSYMAPEQARGEVDQLDERCDVFALGSILCEVLTGEPAFTGRSSGEIQRKASRGGLKDATDRLDVSGVDSDLIALAKDCLAPEREDRPRHAGEVAARINGYQTGVQERLRLAEIARAEEKARAEEATKRVRVERDRLRLTVALAASVLGLALLGGAGAFWVAQQRQLRLTFAATTLARIQSIRDQAVADGAGPARWKDALDAANEALAALGDLATSPPGQSLCDLRDEIAEEQAQAERDRTLIKELTRLRMAVEKGPCGLCVPPDIDRRLARAFKAYGLDLEQRPIVEAIARLKSRTGAFLLQVVGGLDYWLLARNDLSAPAPGDAKLLDLQKLLDVAQGLDSDPERNRLRALVKQSDLKSKVQTLGAMARQAKFVESGPSTALLLARLLSRAEDSKDAVAVLRAAVLRYPGDLWINLELASLLGGADPPQPDESIRYYTVARSLKPETGKELAEVLERQKREDEAEAVLYEVARVDPEPTQVLFQLSLLLSGRGKTDEARAVDERMIAPYREQVKREPNNALAHRKFAVLASLTRDVPGAVAAYREAARIDPKDAGSRRRPAKLLFAQDDLPGAIAAFRDAIRIDPMQARDHYDLAAALERIGDQDGEIAELREAVRIERLIRDAPSAAAPQKNDGAFGDYWIDDLSDSVWDARMSMGVHNGYLFGSAHRIAGDLTDAIAKYRDAIKENPGSEIEARYSLAMALAESGDVPGAIKAFREAIEHARFHHEHVHPQQPTASAAGEASQHEPVPQAGAFSLLRAILMAGRPEESIAPLRRVREQARDDGKLGPAIDLAIRQFEQLSKLGTPIPRFFHLPWLSEDSLVEQRYKRGYFAASAAIWFAAFTADPKLAEDMTAQNRYNAACAAALASDGNGIDRPPPDERAKSRWRKQALDWLRADLAYWVKQIERATPEARARIKQTLQHWKEDTDLAGIRAEKAVSRLAEDEQKACRALWLEVDQLLPEPGKVKRFEGITSTIGMKLTSILPGEFLMGSPADDKEANDSEKPQHRVRITRPFYLGVHEVTQAEYLSVMGENPSDFSPNGRGRDRVAGRSTAQYPVENVSWFDAVRFCNRLSEKERRKPFYEIDGEKVRVPDWNGMGYRLPTEAEWEFACRAGGTSRYYFGDDPSVLWRYAWFKDSSRGTTQPVGILSPNRFGLYDMLGNVWEWCGDTSPAYDTLKDPIIVDPHVLINEESRVFRGAAYPHEPGGMRNAQRAFDPATYRADDVGFRIARSME